MTNLFNLKTIAVIGASSNPDKLGYQLLNNLITAGFTGSIYPINLKEKEILHLKSFSSVLDVHQRIDIAVIMVPREVVPEVLLQCVHKDIPFVLIISAGFAEKDKNGKKLQEEIIRITKNTKTKIVGPNCLGMVDTKLKINLTFAASEVMPGQIGLILQSGAIGAAIFDWAKENQIGISRFLSLGNKVHITEIDSLENFAEDSNTKIIVLYLEEITDPKEFLKICRKITLKKPIIILKGGLTLRGAKAASSHTGALSSPEELNLALFEQSNLIVAQDYEELLNYIEMFQNKIFNITKNTLAIVTNAGGPGILAVDAAIKNNITVPPLDGREKAQLGKEIMNFASLNNPIDLGGDASALNYFNAINFLNNSNKYSSIIVIVTPQTMTDVKSITQILTKFKNSPKPVIACFLGGTKMNQGIQILRKSSLPHYDDPSEAIKLISRIIQYYYSQKSDHSILEVNIDNNFNNLSDEDILRHYNLPFVKSFRVKNDADIMGHLENMSYPVVYKSQKEKMRGKAGKIGLNIGDHTSLERAVKVIGFPGILQKMVDSPYELIVGAKRDSKFGISLLFGQGGIFTEEFDDICLKLLPLTHADLDEMIETTKVWPLIRNFKVKDILKSLILTISKIMEENLDIQEFEINPLKASYGNIIGVDINIKRAK